MIHCIYQWRLSRVYCDCKTSCGLIQDAMVYSAAGGSVLFLILGYMTPNFLYLIFPTLHSSSLWRTDTIFFAKLNKSPLSIKTYPPHMCLKLISTLIMYLRYKKFRSSGIFAHPAGSSDLLSSWASKAFRIANLWRIHGDAGWKICFGQIKGRK